MAPNQDTQLKREFSTDARQMPQQISEEIAHNSSHDSFKFRHHWPGGETSMLPALREARAAERDSSRRSGMREICEATRTSSSIAAANANTFPLRPFRRCPIALALYPTTSIPPTFTCGECPGAAEPISTPSIATSLSPGESIPLMSAGPSCTPQSKRRCLLP